MKHPEEKVENLREPEEEIISTEVGNDDLDQQYLRILRTLSFGY